MTGTEIMAAVIFGIAVFTAIFTVWRYVEGKITAVREKAEQTKEALDAHKLHVAETYVTKMGMQEQTNQLMHAIESVANRIDGIYERLDRWFDKKSPK